MAITVEDIANSIIERVEWDYRNGKLRANVDISDAIHEAVDGALVYTSDIVEYWISAGMPDPEDMGAHDSIIDAITSAVYFDLYDRISEMFSGEETN